MTPDHAPLLDGDQLRSLLQTLKAADSVELKVTVPESSQRSTLAALGVDPLDAQIRQVFFLDTPALDLNRAGLVLRARRIQRQDADTVVKVRPIVPEDLSEEWPHSPGFTVEVDAMPGGHVCSASLRHTVSNDAVRRSVAGEKALRSLFSAPQHAFFDEYAPQGLGLEELSVLGPVFVLKLKLSKKVFPRRIVVEMWLYPDGSRVLELSAKCPPGKAVDVASALRELLSSRGIAVSAQQQTKTRSALEFFAAELSARDRTPAQH